MKVTVTECVVAAALLLSLGAAGTLQAQGGKRPKPQPKPEVEQGNRPQNPPPTRRNREGGPSANDSTVAFTVDPELAKEGADVWINKGCDICHGIGQGKITGPDLQGVNLRRNADWLHDWIRDPAEVARTDSYARTMVSSYNNIVMPNLQLTDRQIDAVINYIAQKSQQQ